MNELIETQHGFKWGFLEVIRIASNDGKDKKKKFNILKIKHPDGYEIEIIATKDELEVKTHAPEVKS